MTIISKYVPVADLKMGMVLAENIHDETGNILLAKGIELRKAYIVKIENLKLQQVLVSDVSKGEADTGVTEAEEVAESDISQDVIIAETREEAKQILARCVESLLDETLPQADKLILIVSQIINEILNSKDVTINLTNLRSVDDYTFEHSVNVCVLSIITGIGVGMNKAELIELGIGAILHDIGKILVPKDVLNKPGLLTDQEFTVIKDHTKYGYEVLSKIENISIESARVALNHHERFDGNGYPENLSVSNIHIYSRIVAVADVFDALTSDRVYSKKISPFKAMEYIISMVGAHFDQEIISKFVKLVGYYYRGQLLRLNTGEVALVVKRHQSKPIVRVMLDKDGKKINDFYEIDISKNPSVGIQNMIFRDNTLAQKSANDNVC